MLLPNFSENIRGRGNFQSVFKIKAEKKAALHLYMAI